MLSRRYKGYRLPGPLKCCHSGLSGIHHYEERFPPSGNEKNRCLLPSHGFTLLEVLVATAILGIAVAVVLQLFSANLRALSMSQDYVSATTRAEAKMREILDDASLAETSLSETTGDGYRIDVSVTNALPERTETLPVKLLEISLTVHWTKELKERSLNLKTIKIVKKEVI